MCGIFGAVGSHPSPAALESVLAVLEHRGPDGNGVFVDEAAGLTLAHTRLAVIDLETGAQPIESRDGNLVLSCNGEIYEFERLRASLEEMGHRFQTRSDSEVILHLYEEYGLDCFEHLRGEFAFLLYDKTKRLLIAARDRFGIKPLYFSRLPHGAVFASEMKALFASGLVTPKLNVSGLDPLLDQDPENVQFPFEGVEHVAPATYWTVDVDSGEMHSTRYWSREIPAEVAEKVSKPFGKVRKKSAAIVLKELEEAVRLRLRADVPVGLYLSGGLDSSFVGALMQRNLESRLHSFSISFVGSDKSEQEYTHRAAEFLGTQHHDLSVTRKMLWDHFEECLWHSELPFYTLAPVGKYLLSKEARRHVTVVLTGEGADEVFLGYRKFFQRAIRATEEVRRGKDAGDLGRLTNGPFGGRVFEWMSLRLFRRSHRRRLVLARSQTRTANDSSKPAINAVQERRIANLPLRILCFLGDRTEMANSLEARLPFLDHKLYDASKWIPVDFKMRGSREKAVLREAAKGILPEKLRLRRKRGFMVTNAAEDFFGSDRGLTMALRRYLRKEAFDRSRVFSYGTYWILRTFAYFPFHERGTFLGQLHQFSNRAILGIVQVHMLQALFIDDPVWRRRDRRSGANRHG